MKKLLNVILAVLCMAVLPACSLTQETIKCIDSEVNPAVLMFISGNDDLNVGDLYYKELGGEKEKIAGDVIKDEYALMPNSQAVVYLDSSNVLYYKAKGAESEKISDRVINSSFTFSKDETAVAFVRSLDDNEESLSELYIKRIGSEKEKVTSNLPHFTDSASYKLSSDASVIYFTDNESVLFRKNGNEDKEKLASDVAYFEINPDGTAYSYLNNQDNYYVKWANDTEPQKISSSGVGDLILSEDGYISVFTDSFNYEKGVGELYAAIKGSDSIKIASDVKHFKLTPDGRYLYYINDESVLYVKELPKVNEKTYQNQTKFSDDVNKSEKIKICSDVSNFSISPGGKSSLIIDNDSNLYLSYNLKEKIRVDSDITQAVAFEKSFIYINKNEQLFLNSSISDLENVKENSKMIAQCVVGFASSEYGKYIMFTTTESSTISVCIDGQKPEDVVTQNYDYDKIIYNGNVIFEKKLRLSDIAGNYKNEQLGEAYKITDKSELVIYKEGEEKENTEFSANGIDKFTLNMSTDNQDSALAQNSYILIKNAEGQVTLEINGEEYSLIGLNDDELNEEIERQKEEKRKEEERRKAEEERKAAEERRKAEEERKKADLEAKKEKMRERGQAYLRNGVYVSSSQTLYYSPSYSNPSNITYTNSGNKNVYDYEISSDGSTLWLKLYTTASSYGGYTGYVWVCE